MRYDSRLTRPRWGRPVAAVPELLVGALCLFLISAAAGLAEASEYSNADWGFTIRFPSGWKVAEPGITEVNGQKLNSPAAAQSEHSLITVTVIDLYASTPNSSRDAQFSRAEIDQQMNDAQNLDNQMKKIRSTIQALPDFTLGLQEIGTLDGTRAVHFQYVASQPFDGDQPEPVAVETYLLTKNGITFAVSSWTERDYFPQLRDTTRASLKSLHVNPLPASVLQASPKAQPPGFFRRIFGGLLDNLISGALWWVAGIVLVLIIGGVSAIASALRRKKGT